MNYFRRLLRNNRLGTLLLAGLVLRSLVAAGFMLDTNPADGSMLSIKLCDGPAGIYKTAGDDQQHQHHHANVEQNEHEQHEQAAQQHEFSACSLWSSSSQLLLLSFALDQLFDNSRHAAVFDGIIVAATHSYARTRFPRAPPALS